MRPSQIKRLMDTLHAHLTSIQEALKEHESASRDTQKAAHEKWREIPGIIAENILGTAEDKETEEAHKRKSESHQDSLIESQNKLVFWTRWAFCAAFIYAGIAAYQGILMRGTLTQMQKQTQAALNSSYMACLNAQSAQKTFAQVQQSARDSHAATVAAIKQTLLEVETERAMISITTDIPKVGEAIDDQFAMHYGMKNEGKSRASTISLRATAVLLGLKDTLHIEKDLPVLVVGRYMAGGVEFPGKSDDPRYRITDPLVAVHNAKGEPVKASSQEAKDFWAGGKNEVFIYGTLEYTDFSGDHMASFCIAESLILPGTMRLPTSGEATCAKYNHQYDQYTDMPKIETIPPTVVNSIQQCFVPEE
jgi:hypothetical protein